MDTSCHSIARSSESPNGEIVDGKASSWMDYTDSDNV